MSRLIVLLVLHEILAGVLVVVPNYGLSFGVGRGGWLLVLVVSVLVWWCWTRGYWLVATGGLINLSDRLRFGYVRDYWHLPMVGLYNNLADWLIFLGLVLLGLSVWRDRR